MNRADLVRAAEEELANRYTNAKYGSLRPGTAPAGAGGAFASQRNPPTRPASRGSSTYDESSTIYNSDRVRETLVQLKRGQSTLSTGDNTSLPSTRPPSAALALYQLHKASSESSLHGSNTSAVSANASSFFERAKFRDLYRQLDRNTKKPYFAATWDEAALQSMEANLFEQTHDEPLSHGGVDEVNSTTTMSGLPSPNAKLIEQLYAVHSAIDERVTSEVGGDGLSIATDPDARLEYFQREVCGPARLQRYPALMHFAKMIIQEHERYISHLKRETGTSEAALLRETLYSTVKELADVKRQYLEAEKKNQEMSVFMTKLTAVNEQSQRNQTDLEQYVDELRVTLSTFTNTNLRGAPAMRPDTSTRSGFSEAIRRLAKEVEHLRDENVRLSDIASSYVERQESQAAELQVLLQKASLYQQQVAQLKAAIRTMKLYVEQLEQRLRELRNVHEENELLRSTVPMQVAKYEREVVLPMELCMTLAQHQFLQQKGANLIAPAEYSDTPVVAPADEKEKLVQLVAHRIPQRVVAAQHNTEDVYEGEGDDEFFDSNDLSGMESGVDEGGANGTHEGSGTNPSSGSRLAPSSVAPSEFAVVSVPLPIHLSTRFGNAKLKPMTANDVKGLIVEMFTEYGNVVTKKRSKDPGMIPPLFEQFAKEWSHRRLKGERVSFEQNMSLFYWADVYRHKAPEMVMYYKASVGHVSGFVLELVQSTIASIKRALTQLEPVNKKIKDRITRLDFIGTIRKELPHLTPLQLEALVASSILAQDGKYSEELSYEPFFDRTNQSGALMYDALARAVIAHAESLYLRVEEAVYEKLHEENTTRFEQLQRTRDETGASGSLAIEQMMVESAVAEKVGRCQLRLVSEALLDVDPHMPKPALRLALAIAAGGLPELNKQSSSKHRDDDALEVYYPVDMLLRNVRRGVLIVLSPPPPPEEKADATPIAKGAVTGTPDQREVRSSRPPSAKFVTD